MCRRNSALIALAFFCLLSLALSGCASNPTDAAAQGEPQPAIDNAARSVDKTRAAATISDQRTKEGTAVFDGK